MVAPILTREQWLTMRSTPRILLGASSAAAACGEDRNESRLHLYHRKLGNIPEEDLSHNDAVYFGNELEPIIVRTAAKRLNLRVLDPYTERDLIELALTRDGGCEVLGWVVDGDRAPQPFVRSIARPWQVTTLDGCAFDAAGRFGLIEAKANGEYRKVEWGRDESDPAPQEYRLQGNHQLAVVTSAQFCYLAALVGGNAFRSHLIERDAAWIDPVCALEADFMRRLDERDEPPADGSESTKLALKALHPDDDGSMIVLPTECIEIHARLRELATIEKAQKEAAKPITDEIDALENRMRQLVGAHTFAELPNGAAMYSLKTTERRIGLPVAELPAEFVRVTTYRTLRLVAPSKSRSK